MSIINGLNNREKKLMNLIKWIEYTQIITRKCLCFLLKMEGKTQIFDTFSLSKSKQKILENEKHSMNFRCINKIMIQPQSIDSYSIDPIEKTEVRSMVMPIIANTQDITYIYTNIPFAFMTIAQINFFCLPFVGIYYVFIAIIEMPNSLSFSYSYPIPMI